MLSNTRRSKCNDRFFFIPITLPITIFCILNFMENCLEIVWKPFKNIPHTLKMCTLELAKSAMDEELIKNVLHRQTFVSLIRIISLG